MPCKCPKRKQPSFGLPDDKRPTCCASCKTDGMIDIKNPRCGCPKNAQPFFGFSGDKTASRCPACKLVGMIDIKSRRCGCPKQLMPSFGLPNDKRATACSFCKTGEMINIKNTRCGCPKNNVASYAVRGNKIPSACIFCKTDEMENIMYKRCNCPKHRKALFGLPTDKHPTCCSSCKTQDMVDIKHASCKCPRRTRASFGLSTDKVPSCCVICKTDAMVDIVNRKCKSEWCDTSVGKKYDGYCMHCFIHLFPDKPVVRNYKTKEQAVVEYIKAAMPDIDIVSDRKIQDGCSRRRPDIFIDMGDQVIIVEIDENQHTNYDSSCENKRIMQLSQDVGHRNIVFIRFNPDGYKTSSGNVSSCWVIKYGIYDVSEKKRAEWNERLDTLHQTIVYWLENRTNKLIEIVQLYYDETI